MWIVVICFAHFCNADPGERRAFASYDACYSAIIRKADPDLECVGSNADLATMAAP